VRSGARQLIDDLLELSRVSRAELARERVDLSGLARVVAAELARTDPERGVRFDIADGLTADGDPRLLRIVLENLLGNAWKYSRAAATPRIEFGAQEHEKVMAFHVRDNGAGFDMNFAHKLFVPFERLHTIEEFPGTGIGLATVERIISRHGGQFGPKARSERGNILLDAGEGNASLSRLIYGPAT
jgi:light-regulated signal transduction histidine kinase (bacteriophytochrome)